LVLSFARVPAKPEHRIDMYVARYAALSRRWAGDLDIVARFQDGDLRLTRFQKN